MVADSITRGKSPCSGRPEVLYCSRRASAPSGVVAPVTMTSQALCSAAAVAAPVIGTMEPHRSALISGGTTRRRNLCAMSSPIAAGRSSPAQVIRRYVLSRALLVDVVAQLQAAAGRAGLQEIDVVDQAEVQQPPFVLVRRSLDHLVDHLVGTGFFRAERRAPLQLLQVLAQLLRRASILASIFLAVALADGMDGVGIGKELFDRCVRRSFGSVHVIVHHANSDGSGIMHQIPVEE